MTVTEASENYRIPKSRIRTAIKRGILKATQLPNGRYEIDACELASKMKRHMQFSRNERQCEEVTYEALVSTKRSRFKFATTGGAAAFEELHRKNGSTPLPE